MFIIAFKRGEDRSEAYFIGFKEHCMWKLTTNKNRALTFETKAKADDYIAANKPKLIEIARQNTNYFNGEIIAIAKQT